MRIVDIREATIHTGENRSNAVMNFGDMTTGLVAVVTDVVRNGKPIIGYGFSGTGRYSQNAICRDRLIPRILNAPSVHADESGSNLDPFAIWDCMMTNEKPGGHGDRAIAVGTLDMAVWDAAAKIADVPLTTFLAGRYGFGTAPEKIPVYVGGGYYYPGSDDRLLQDEIRKYHDAGFNLVKIKVGGASLDVDRRRIESVLKVTDSSNLAVDANGRFLRDEALRYAEALAPYKLSWFEEPGYPLDYALNAEVASSYQGALGTGECLLSTWDARNLLEFGGLRPDQDILMFDCALSYGICEYIRTIHMMEQYGWARKSLYPHGGHLLSLHLTAGLGLGFTEAYPYTHQPMGGFTDGLRIDNGFVDVPQLPGLGFEGKANIAALFAKLS